MKILALIPARQGSKSIPNKNILEFRGKPLLAHAIECAKNSGVVDRIVLSSDSNSYLEIGKKYGAESSLRPTHLAADTTPMADVIRYELERLKTEGYVPDAVMLLQPTQPLRTSNQLIQAVKEFQTHPECDSVVSVVEVPKHYSPQFVMQLRNGKLSFYESSGGTVTRRQDAVQVYSRDGTVYLFKTASFFKYGNIYGETSLPLIIPHDQSINLDTTDDLALLLNRE